MGIKLIAEYLNRRNYKTSTGGDYYISIVHNILTHSAYKGIHLLTSITAGPASSDPGKNGFPYKYPLL